jgi:dTDP-4-dehydrorhamnose reductase
MTTILVTGAGGQLGSELSTLASRYSGYEFIFTDINTLDLTDKDAVLRYISETNPSWIINCAAYTAVDKAEDEPAATFAVNAAGPAHIAAAINGSDCRLIHISTDYVFDGSQNIPYLETDEPCPDTIYGKSKLEGEINVLSHPWTMIIRTSWLYSQFGVNFVKKILQFLNEGRHPEVVFDQTGSPTYAAGLAEAILIIISGVIRNKHPYVPGIYNYSDEGVCSWYDMAETIATNTGRPGIVRPCLTGQFPSKAHRPHYSVLNKQKIKDTYDIGIPHWQKNLIHCIENLTI